MSINYTKIRRVLEKDDFLQKILELQEITGNLCISRQQMNRHLECLQKTMNSINGQIQKFDNK